jgi:uncharacterized protein YjbI with pentapeptide repeats
VSKPPLEPYPPDPDEDAEAATELGDLTDAVVEDADWSNQRGRGAVLKRVELVRCRLTGVELAEASLADVTFAECRLDLAGLRTARLERVVFRDCRLGECDFYEAILKDVRFERCELREASFDRVRVERVELRGCDLTGVAGVESLRGARLAWDDVVQNAPVFALGLGLELVD